MCVFWRSRWRVKIQKDIKQMLFIEMFWKLYQMQSNNLCKKKKKTRNTHTLLYISEDRLVWSDRLCFALHLSASPASVPKIPLGTPRDQRLSQVSAIRHKHKWKCVSTVIEEDVKGHSPLSFQTATPFWSCHRVSANLCSSFSHLHWKPQLSFPSLWEWSYIWCAQPQTQNHKRLPENMSQQKLTHLYVF